LTGKPVNITDKPVDIIGLSVPESKNRQGGFGSKKALKIVGFYFYFFL
jgi:hypothetical protein